MVYSDYAKQRILFYYRSKKNSSQIVRCLAEEGHTVSKAGVLKFLRRYRQTGTITRAPGSGQASKLTDKIRETIDDQMKKNDETTGLELQKLLKKEIEGFDASVSSILRRRNDLGWTAKGTKYCQMIREVNKEKRLKWAKDTIRTPPLIMLSLRMRLLYRWKLTGVHVVTGEGASHAINPSLSIL